MQRLGDRRAIVCCPLVCGLWMPLALASGSPALATRMKAMNVAPEGDEEGGDDPPDDERRHVHTSFTPGPAGCARCRVALRSGRDRESESRSGSADCNAGPWNARGRDDERRPGRAAGSANTRARISRRASTPSSCATGSATARICWTPVTLVRVVPDDVRVVEQDGAEAVLDQLRLGLRDQLELLGRVGGDVELVHPLVDVFVVVLAVVVLTGPLAVDLAEEVRRDLAGTGRGRGPAEQRGVVDLDVLQLRAPVGVLAVDRR